MTNKNRIHISMTERNEHPLPDYKPWMCPEYNNVAVTKTEGLSEILHSLYVNESFLTIVDARGQKYGRSLILDLTDNRIFLYKPWDWNDNIRSCHIFFKNKLKSWHFLRIGQIDTHPHSLIAQIPDDLYLLKR
jgi:hypothetical protein